MDNVSIAKSNIKKIRLRTEMDLYYLNYGIANYEPLNEEIFEVVKKISKENNIICPLYKWGGVIKVKANLYKELNLLADKYSIIFNLKGSDNHDK